MTDMHNKHHTRMFLHFHQLINSKSLCRQLFLFQVVKLRQKKLTRILRELRRTFDCIFTEETYICRIFFPGLLCWKITLQIYTDNHWLFREPKPSNIWANDEIVLSILVPSCLFQSTPKKKHDKWNDNALLRNPAAQSIMCQTRKRQKCQISYTWRVLECSLLSLAGHETRKQWAKLLDMHLYVEERRTDIIYKWNAFARTKIFLPKETGSRNDWFWKRRER